MIEWYSLDPELHTVEHGPVALAEALGIVEGYFSRLRPRYETGEVAIAATSFGFM